MIELSLEIVGQEKALALLGKIDRNLSSRTWRKSVTGTMEQVLEQARDLSPVDTGSYQGAHRIAITDSDARLFIDPGARNFRTGIPVTEYAGVIEHRVGVYGMVVNGPYADNLAQLLSREVMG